MSPLADLTYGQLTAMMLELDAQGADTSHIEHEFTRRRHLAQANTKADIMRPIERAKEIDARLERDDRRWKRNRKLAELAAKEMKP